MVLRKRVSEREEIAELRNRVEQLEKEKQQLQVALPSLKIEEDLTQRESIIVQYLKQNPGTSKQSVINELTTNENGSRVTVLKAIKRLESYAVISARKDKKNSSFYKLYLNENSVFLSVYSELEELKNAFSNLIEKLGNTPAITTTDTISAGDPFYNITGSDARYYDLLFIYHQILGIYVTYSVLKWPNQVKDKPILNKIYAIIFYTMIEIQKQMSKVFKLPIGIPDYKDATFGQAFNPLTQQFINSVFLIRPRKMAEILKDYGFTSIRKRDLTKENEGVKKDIASLLEVVWKIGFPIYLYLDPTIWSDFHPEDIDKLKDWKYAMTNRMANVAQGKYHIITPPDAAKGNIR
jgi:hypothetical protein